MDTLTHIEGLYKSQDHELSKLTFSDLCSLRNNLTILLDYKQALPEYIVSYLTELLQSTREFIAIWGE